MCVFRNVHFTKTTIISVHHFKKWSEVIVVYEVIEHGDLEHRHLHVFDGLEIGAMVKKQKSLKSGTWSYFSLQMFLPKLV